MYEIYFSAAGARDYKKLPDDIVPGINEAIDTLEDNPRPRGCTKLKKRDAFRICVGNYRIIYEINDKKITVLVVRIRHRKEVYEK